MGGGWGGGVRAPLVIRYWGSTRHLFLLTLCNSKNVGGGGGYVPLGSPAPRSLNQQQMLHYTIELIRKK